MFDGQDLAISSTQYTNAAGNQIFFSTVKYRISLVVLHRTDGTTYEANNYEILDAGVPTEQSFVLKDLPEGTYDGISFVMGVDSAHNHTGDQTGNLDPAVGMFWSWNIGYVFTKFEGTYSSGTPFSLHIGTDSNLLEVNDLTTQPFTLAKNSKTRLNLKFNVAEAFKTPNTIDLTVDGDQVHGASPLATHIYENLGDAFSFRIS